MKKILALFLALTMVLSLAGCMQPEPEETQPTEPSVMEPPAPVKKTVHILLPKDMEALSGEVTEAVAAAGDFEIKTQTYEDMAQQTQLLEQIAADSNGDGSLGVVTVGGSEELTEPMAALLQANVSYTLSGTIPQEAAAGSVANVYYDQQAIGAAAAAHLVSQGLKEGDKVLILAGLTDEEAARTQGFKLYLQGKIQHDGKTIEESWTSLSSIIYSDMQGDTQQAAADYFTSFMDSSKNAKTSYIAAWDDAYVMGILDALEGEDIDGDRMQTFLDREPHITGYGGSETLTAVIAGTVENGSAARFGSIDTIVRNDRLPVLAAQALAEYFAGGVVEQDQPQPIVWFEAQTPAQE